MSTYNPDNWLISMQRALAAYVKSEIDKLINVGGDDKGLEIYDVVFDSAEADDIPRYVQEKKTVIYFTLDDIDHRLLGMGDNLVNATENISGDPDTVTWEEGQAHLLNYDVGVMATDVSGGATARLQVMQALQQILNTTVGKKKLWEDTEGVQVIRFQGGRFIRDRISDVRVYRVIDAELVVQVFSRVFLDPAVIVDTEPVQEPDVEIDGFPIT